MSKRIDANFTRRQMSQIKVYSLPVIAEAFKTLCKDNDTSAQQVLENYIQEYLTLAGINIEALKK